MLRIVTAVDGNHNFPSWRRSHNEFRSEPRKERTALARVVVVAAAAVVADAAAVPVRTGERVHVKRVQESQEERSWNFAERGSTALLLLLRSGTEGQNQ